MLSHRNPISTKTLVTLLKQINKQNECSISDQQYSPGTMIATLSNPLYLFAGQIGRLSQSVLIIVQSQFPNPSDFSKLPINGD